MKPELRPIPCLGQSDAAARTPNRPTPAPSHLRPRPSPAARMARTLRAALWPSSSQQSSPGTAAQSDAAYANALARVRQRAADLVATVSSSPRKQAPASDPVAPAPATQPASSSFAVVGTLRAASANGSPDATTPAKGGASPAESSASVGSDPAFWGSAEVEGPLTVHMRDSPALSHMLAGVTGRPGICDTILATSADDDAPTQSISFGRAGAAALAHPSACVHHSMCVWQRLIPNPDHTGPQQTQPASTTG